MSERPDLPRDLVRFWEKLVNMGLEDRFSWSYITLPETNRTFSPLKMDDWKTTSRFLLGILPIFRGELLVLGSVNS